MNFYIGNCTSEIQVQDTNVLFSAEFGEFLYENKNSIPADLSWLFAIDPYDDVQIKSEDVPAINASCSMLQKMRVWEQYEFPDEGKLAINGLKDLTDKAIFLNKGLISVGD